MSKSNKMSTTSSSSTSKSTAAQSSVTTSGIKTTAVTQPHTFVNFAAAAAAAANQLSQKVRPDVTVPLSIRPQLQGTVSCGANAVPHLPGAINLTITNGAVNLRGAGPGSTTAVNLRGMAPTVTGTMNMRGAGPGVTVRPGEMIGPAVIRANINGAGIPIQLQNVNQSGMKLNPIKLPININPGMNLRLTVPPGVGTGNPGQKQNLVAIRQLSPPTSMLQPVNIPMQRIPVIPIASGANCKFPIAHLQPLTLRPLTTVTGSAAPVPMTVEALSTRMTPDTGLVYAKQMAANKSSTSGSKKSTGETVVKELSKVKSVRNKPNIVPKKSKPKQERVGSVDEGPVFRYDEYYLKDKEGRLHHHKELKPKYYRDIKQEDGSVLRFQNVDGFKASAKDYISAEEYSRVQKLKETCVRVSLEEGKKMIEADKQHTQEVMMGEGGLDLSTKGRGSESGGKVEEESSESESESEGDSSGSEKSDEEDDTSLDDSDENDKEDEEDMEGLEDENRADKGDGDEAVATTNPLESSGSRSSVGDDGLEWKDGIGTLPGSDMKFRMNEFGVLEMITEIEGQVTNGKAELNETAEVNQHSSGKSETTDLSAVLCCCETCGIHGSAAEFLSGGRFCSSECVNINADKQRLKQKTSLGQVVKRKKRKMSTESNEQSTSTGNKVMRKKFEDDALSTCSTESTPKKVDDPVAMKTKTTVPTGGKRAKSFSWNTYLEEVKAIAAPTKLFRKYQLIPEVKNQFKVSMRLEAINPRRPSQYCAATVAEVKAFRIRVHIDSQDTHDFWTNADSPFIFHVGWSEKNGKALQPPKAYTGNKPFEWAEWLKLHSVTAAPKSLFTTVSTTSSTPHGFRTGMKLEAVDKKNSNSSCICVATVADVLKNNILVHFDGWESEYDYWCDTTSPDIHPVGWCQDNNVTLCPPKFWKEDEAFTWDKYLAEDGCQQVPPRAFKPRNINSFEVNMRLEVVDRRNPVLVRAATVVEVEAYSFKIHFDGWFDRLDYVVEDDSPDIHPCGWCAKTGHPLTPPILPQELRAKKSEGCPTPGCTGIGHVRGSKYTNHHSAFGCPYATANISKETSFLDQFHLRPEAEGNRRGRKPSDRTSPAESTKDSVSPLDLQIKREFDSDLAAQLLIDNGGRPLYGKGSGRGRKKTIVKLMQEMDQLRAKAQSQQVPNSTTFQPVQKPVPLSNGLGMLSPLISGSAHPLNLFNEATSSGSAAIHHSVFTPTPSPHPYQDLPLGWEQNSSRIMSNINIPKTQEVVSWNAHQVADYVATFPGCKDVAKDLEKQDVDGEAFLLMNQADLVRVLKIKLGPALKVHNSIQKLKKNLD